MTTPLFGYKPDVFDPRDFRLRDPQHKTAVFGDRVGVFKRRWSWLDKCAPIRNQPGNNCVNEALSRAAHTAAAIVGEPIAYPSCTANYAVGRTLEHGPDATFLPDDGSYPRLVMQGARQFGMVPIKEYDDAVDLTKPAPFDVFTTGAHAKLQGFYRLEAADTELFCAAIERGHIPIIGRTVGDDYMNLGSEIYEGRKSYARGGHMEAVVGYNLDAAIPYCEVVGSWGTGFANGGVALCSLRSVMIESYDRYVVTLAPRI